MDTQTAQEERVDNQSAEHHLNDEVPNEELAANAPSQKIISTPQTPGNTNVTFAQHFERTRAQKKRQKAAEKAATAQLHDDAQSATNDTYLAELTRLIDAEIAHQNQLQAAGIVLDQSEGVATLLSMVSEITHFVEPIRRYQETY